jgi:hypothetical protein
MNTDDGWLLRAVAFDATLSFNEYGVLRKWSITSGPIQYSLSDQRYQSGPSSFKGRQVENIGFHLAN